MGEGLDHVPGYRMIRVTAPATPAEGLADERAWLARDAYPEVRFAGGPGFGLAREREDGGWEVLAYSWASYPQDTRDTMGSHFRKLAAEAEQGGNQAASAECLAAAERMDWEALDEATVLGARYRVVRADNFVRAGASGPQPPHPSDPDPSQPGQAYKDPDAAAGFVVDPGTAATGMSEAITLLELLEAIRKQGTVPAGVRDDSARAALTHPGGALLPAAFTAAEIEDGHWRPLSIGTSATPQAARDHLAMYLRVSAPWELNLNPAERAEYAAAADQLDATRADDLTVAGRQFKIARIERLMRVGPDGPEGPRPSDPDPQPPVMVQAQDQPDDGDEDPDAPIQLSDDAQRFLEFFHEEEERRRNASGKAGTRAPTGRLRPPG